MRFGNCRPRPWTVESKRVSTQGILGDPGAASRDDGIFMGESLQQERENPNVDILY